VLLYRNKNENGSVMYEMIVSASVLVFWLI